MRIVLTVDIDSDTETVFSWLADPERARAWMTSVAATEIVDRKPGMVGTTFRERVEDAEGGIDMEGSVTGFEPDRRISFHLESRVNEVEVDYTLEPVGGKVRLVLTSTVRWRFPVSLIALCAGRAMKGKIEAQSNEELARLKRLCEAGVPLAQASTI
jgi:uncharacterized protein YndB with AHSA1/START domain